MDEPKINQQLQLRTKINNHNRHSFKNYNQIRNTNFLKFTRFTLLTTILLNVIPSTLSASSSPNRVVCYYTNWSAYRQGPAKFLPDNINPYLCTHLIYAFGGLTSEPPGLKPFDKYQDVDKSGFTKFNGLKTYNKELKTLLAIGGWNEGSARFSRLVADEEARSTFIKNCIRFLRQWFFDGLDLDWEYPGSRDGSEPEDKENYAVFIKELAEEFQKEAKKSHKPKLLLTIAVPAGIEWIEKGFDVPSINKHVDFINMLTYDFHASTEPAANHHAAFKSMDGYSDYDYKSQLNIQYAVEYYIKQGADKAKLVVGLPTYGRSFNLFNKELNEVGAPSSGPGKKGKYTKEPGYLAYYEICEGIKAGDWRVENADSAVQGPHAIKDDQWVGYDDPRIVAIKSKWVRDESLGGIMFWSIDNDDFRGSCHGKPFPLIEAAKTAYLTGEVPKQTQTISRFTTNANNNGGSNRITTPKPPSTTTGAPTSNNVRRFKPKKDKKTTKTTGGRRRRLKSTTTSTTSSPPPAPTIDPFNTPAPPTTPDPGTDFECKDEGFFPHPKDCKKYFWCLDAPGLGLVAHHFTCPAGLFFNKNTDSCDYARNVPCKPGGTTTKPTTTTTTSTTSTTTAAPEYEYYDDDEEEEDDEKDVKGSANAGKSVKEIKDIKDLLSLIKKLGGVEELEKYLADNPNVDSQIIYEYDEEDDDDDDEEKPKSIIKATARTSTTTRRPTNRYTSIQRTTRPSTPSTSTTEKSTKSKYVTLNRGNSNSRLKSSTKASPSSSTQTSVVVRYTDEDKFDNLEDDGGEDDTADDETEEESIAVVSKPYAKVKGTLEYSSGSDENANNNKKKSYTSVTRDNVKKNNAATEVKKSEADKTVEDDETEEVEYYEDEPVTTSTSTTTTRAPNRLRIPSNRRNPISSTKSTTSSTTEAPAVTTRRHRVNFNPSARKNPLLERQRGTGGTTSTAASTIEDEGVDESIITESELPINKSTRRRFTTTSTSGSSSSSSTPRSRRRNYNSNNSNNNNNNVDKLNTAKFDDIEIIRPNNRRRRPSSTPSSSIDPSTTTTLNPLFGTFQSAVVRRRTRRPSTILVIEEIKKTTPITSTTKRTTTTTTTSRPSTAKLINNKPKNFAYANDYYYYYYDDDDDDLDTKQSQRPGGNTKESSAIASAIDELKSASTNQFQRRSLQVSDYDFVDSSPSASSSALKNSLFDKIYSSNNNNKSNVTKNSNSYSNFNSNNNNYSNKLFNYKLKEVKNNTPSPTTSSRTKTSSTTKTTEKPSKRSTIAPAPSIPLSAKVKLHDNNYIECLDVGIFPHPSSCSQYINCVQNENGGNSYQGWIYSCPKYLTFDIIGGMCNWATRDECIL